MAHPELIPAELPPIRAAGSEALKEVVSAIAQYEGSRERYARAAKLFHHHEGELRQQQRLQKNLAERKASLTEQVKRQLLKEHSARRNNPLGPPGETRDQLAERLLNERYVRQYDERMQSSQPRSRFDIRNLSPGAILKSLRALKQPHSERAFTALGAVEKTAARIDERGIYLNPIAGEQRVSTQAALDAAAKALANIATAVGKAQRRGDLSNADQRVLQGLQASIELARKSVDAGRARFDAMDIKQPDQLAAVHAIKQQEPTAVQMHIAAGIQPDGPLQQRPSRRTNRGTDQPSTLAPQQRSDHPLLAQYGLRSPSREPTQTVPSPAPSRSPSR
jgi:hypothetical protein